MQNVVKFENTQSNLVRSKVIVRSPIYMGLFMKPVAFVSLMVLNRNLLTLLLAELQAFESCNAGKDR